MQMRRALIGAIVAAAVGLSACARVKPHQREHLAHPGMQGAPWPAVSGGAEHVQDVREGSGGATGDGAGGCGCN